MPDSIQHFFPWERWFTSVVHKTILKLHLTFQVGQVISEHTPRRSEWIHVIPTPYLSHPSPEGENQWSIPSPHFTEGKREVPQLNQSWPGTSSWQSSWSSSKDLERENVPSLTRARVEPALWFSTWCTSELWEGDLGGKKKMPKVQPQRFSCNWSGRSQGSVFLSTFPGVLLWN